MLWGVGLVAVFRRAPGSIAPNLNLTHNPHQNLVIKRDLGWVMTEKVTRQWS